MQKLKSFWRSSSSIPVPQSTPELREQSSFLQQATNYISSYRRQPTIMSTAQFQQYLGSIPQQYKKFKKNYQHRKSNKSFQSVKPQLVKRVYQKVESSYFSQKFKIDAQYFQKNKKSNRQKQIMIHESLDQVQVALFNQITARFDQILSVLRTVESLGCLVQYNIDKIQRVRSTNIQTTRKVTERQIKIVRCIQKKKNLELSIKHLHKLKLYSQFIKKQQIPLSADSSAQKQSTSQLYESIQDIKKQVSFLGKLSCCQRLDIQIQTTQQDLKKSFSETLNQLIYQYTVGKISTYRKSYWDKFRYKLDILEEQRNQQQGTVFLDESTIVQDDLSHLDQAKLSLQQDNQNIILKNITRGWNQGDYAVGGLKSIIERHIKTLHLRFVDDLRSFCDWYLKNNQKQVSNPCLQDLLQQFKISFFTKCCLYYSTLFQNLIYRLNSITVKSLVYIIKVSMSENQEGQNPLTIEQKEKLAQMMDGIMNVLTFVWKSIIDKFAELIQSKQVVQTYDITDFKAFIGVIQNLQDFFSNKIVITLINVQCPQQSFLYQKFTQIKQSLPYHQIINFKKAKLLEYLSKMHKNAIEIQLKQSLQNQVWTPTDIPTFYYDSLHYIITGQSLNLRRNRGLRSTNNTSTIMGGHTFMYDTSVLMDSMYKEQSYIGQNKTQMSSNFRIIRTQIIVENQTFKITSTILLLLQIVEDYMLLHQFYPEIREQIAMKISEMLRSYNASSLQLIVHAGAVVLGKIKTKSITAKHLALSTLCLRFCMFILDCIKNRASLNDFQKLYKDIQDHAETTTRKLQTILKSKIIQSLPEIRLDASPTKGTQSIVNSCKILHDILIDFFDSKTIKKIFTKQIFNQYLGKISTLKVQSKSNAESLKDDVNFFFNQLKFLAASIQNFQQYRVHAEDIVRKAFQVL